MITLYKHKKENWMERDIRTPLFDSDINIWDITPHAVEISLISPCFACQLINQHMLVNGKQRYLLDL